MLLICFCFYFRKLIEMADAAVNNEAVVAHDLEDGEIESDCEEEIQKENQNTEQEAKNSSVELKAEENKTEDDVYYSRSGKKKKSKNKEYKSKDRSKKYSKRPSPSEEDFAGSIEKAIRKVLNKDDGESDTQQDGDERRKRKKRKKHDGKESSSKKKKKHDYSEEVDENEMMFVRGASPIQKQPSPIDGYHDEDQDSYASDSSDDSRDHHSRQRHRTTHRKNKGDRDRRRGVHPMQDPDGVCLYYMQGKCHKGDDCIYSHDAQPPRKMELCKFYLMDCCAKRDKCLYMHSDFPCKYYHTGLPCIYKDDCKFAHGKPLSESLKTILLKHIESAPKEILGDFPRLSKEGACNMIANTQTKLMQQFPSEVKETQEKTIPSLFELNIPKPPNLMDSSILSINNDKSHKSSSKVRQSRWQNENANNSPNYSGSPVNVLSIKNLNGVLSPRQISDLTKMGIENLDQLGQLTVLQLNSIGISLKQITEIQLNTMNIQKLGLINSNAESLAPTFMTSVDGPKDLDLRVPPAVLPVATPLISDLAGKDVDMRFQPSITDLQTEDKKQEESTIQSTESLVKDVIDIDQYTKDALKFATKEKEDSINSNENIEMDKTLNNDIPRTVISQVKDVDQRVLKFADDHSDVYNKINDSFNEKKESDNNMFLQPEPIFKNPNKTYRRSTTDDEDNNLLIDEKWYSSDEEKCSKPKSNSPSPVPSSPQTPNQTQMSNIEPETVLSKLGDLSQIAISDEVTKLLNTMKNNLQEVKTGDKSNDLLKSSVPRDPRSALKRSPDHKNNELNKLPYKRSPRVSIYECVEGEPTDGRRRSDVDLRHSDFKFGESNTSGDVDFRLSLPFKAIPNYTPASEIDGSLNSHPPIVYKVVTIDIPRPDYTDIRNSTAKSQALLDPRLRKVFRLSLDDSNSDSEKSTKQPVLPRVDPRRKPKEVVDLEPKQTTLELQTVLQNSEWYRDLSSTHKIFVNQNLALVTSIIKQYQQDKSPAKKFDLTLIQTNSNLVNIFNNLGVTLNDNAEFSYLPKQKEALLKTPISYNQNFNISGTNIDGNNMNIMNMPQMNMGGVGQMSVGPIPGFNHPISDPRGGPTPGLLGIAPNIPHNYDNNFNGPNNFGNVPFNGSGNDFNNMNVDSNYHRFSNRGGYRGRGSDRWNRGAPQRGHRDRKGYDRGGWKGERK